jgi:ssDNA-binding Zn-finger/Zn-ribbon topoisomerase 1
MSGMKWERERIEARDRKQPRKYKPFKRHKHKPKQKQQKQNAPPPAPVPACPHCKSPMVRRTSEFGPFWGCKPVPAVQGHPEITEGMNG